jgi:hypothetical protein
VSLHFNIPQREAEEEFTVSYSQIGAWQKCHKFWQHAYLEGLTPATQPDYLRLGTYVHTLLEMLYSHLQAGFPVVKIREIVANYATEQLTTEVRSEDLGTVTKALRLVLRYIDDVQPMFDEGAKIEGVEYHFKQELHTPKGRKFYLQGYVDLILMIQGHRWIIDHKTSNNKIWSLSQMMMDGQLTTYAAVIPNIFGVGINFFNTYDYKDWWATPIDKLYKRVTTHRTEKEKQAILHNFSVIVYDIEDRKETGNFPFSLTKDCARCPFAEMCLMELKGFSQTDLADFAETVFIKKGSGPPREDYMQDELE